MTDDTKKNEKSTTENVNVADDNQATTENINNECASNLDNETDKESTDQINQQNNQKQELVVEKNIDWKDKYLRLSAEFDNYRKRTLKEKYDLIKSASEETILSILPVFDDFERALISINNSNDLESLKQGIELIYQKFKDVLSAKGVKEIEALHKEFDLELHEAINKTKVDREELKGKIVEVIEKGYYQYDKIIRYPKVVIGE